MTGQKNPNTSSVHKRERPLILIADDSPTALDILKYIFDSNDLDTITASNGVETVQMFYEHGPDIAIVDLEMPKMSGYQVCRLIKSDPAANHIPIIILTSKSYKQNKFWGLYSGADDYLTKDFEIEGLLGRVKFHLDNRQVLTGTRPVHAKTIAEDQIIENVNDALDKKLFETTIMYEVAQVALSNDTLEEKVGQVLVLMNRVCDYTVASILIVDSGQGKLFLENPGMASEDYIFNHVEMVMLESQNYDLKFDTQRVMVNQWNAGRDKGQKYNNIQSQVSFPLKVRGITHGIITYSHYAAGVYPQMVIELLERTTAQVSILIDAAILFNVYSKFRSDLMDHIQVTFNDITAIGREIDENLNSNMNKLTWWI